MDVKQIEREARTLSIQLARQIVAKANERPVDETFPFAGTTASLILQTLLISGTVQVFAPGSPEGEASLRETYDVLIRDAVLRWHASDLKERRAGGFI